MALRLFHITEFAESTLLSPQTQRESTHPLKIILATSLWLVIACNLPLWRALSHLPLETGQIWWLGIRLALIMVFALCALLPLLSWYRLFKPSVTLLLLLAAFNMHFMLTQETFVDVGLLLQNPASQLRTPISWQLAGWLLVLGILPSLLLWRTAIRRRPLLRSLRQNTLASMLSCSLLAAVWLASKNDVSSLLHSQPQLHHLLNPFNSFHTLAPEQLAWVLPI